MNALLPRLRDYQPRHTWTSITGDLTTDADRWRIRDRIVERMNQLRRQATS